MCSARCVAGVGVGALSGVVSVIWSPATAPFVLFSPIVLALLLRPQGLFARGGAPVIRRGADRLRAGASLAAGRRCRCTARRSASRCSTSCCSTTVLFWIAQATSWNLLSGYSGYFSFGQAAYVGIGAYTMAVLTGRHGVELLPDRSSVGGRAVRRAGAGDRRGRVPAARRCAARSSRCSPWPCRSSWPRWPASTGPSTAARAPSCRCRRSPGWIGEFQHCCTCSTWWSPIGARRGRRSPSQHSPVRLGAGRDPRRRGRRRGARRGDVPLQDDGHRARRPCIGGIGGALFALQIGFVTVESVFRLTIPLFVIVMSVLGGRTHWLGPVVGAVLIVLLQDRLTAAGLERGS